MPQLIIKGRVESGRKLGRTLGFPTANVALDPSLQVEIGVYLSKILIGDQWLDGVTNVGINPTVGGNTKRSESHIFNFSGDLYGKHITIKLLDQLRGEMRFNSIEALRQQIIKDVERAKKMLK